MKQEIFFYYFPDELRHEQQQRILHPATPHDPLEKFPTLLNLENVEIVSSILNLRIL